MNLNIMNISKQLNYAEYKSCFPQRLINLSVDVIISELVKIPLIKGNVMDHSLEPTMSD